MTVKEFYERAKGGQEASQMQVWGAGQLDQTLAWIDLAERLLRDVAAGQLDRDCRLTAKDLLYALREQ